MILRTFGLNRFFAKKIDIVIQLSEDRLDYKTHCSNRDQELCGEVLFMQDSSDDKYDIALNQLIEIVNPKTKKYLQFFIYIDSNLTKQALLTLPNSSLTVNEISLFANASIYKLFNLSPNEVLFDYSYSGEDKLSITICNRSYIQRWQERFAKLNLNLQFIGLKSPDCQQINFLPWRKAQKRRQTAQLLIIMITLLVTALSLLGYLWLATENQSHYYAAQIVEQQKQIITEQLPNNIDLPDSQTEVYQLLTTLSNTVPFSVGLTLLDYDPEKYPPKIVMKGYSYRYADITTFIQNLSAEPLIKTAQIIAITRDHVGLQFELSITSKTVQSPHKVDDY